MKSETIYLANLFRL